MWRANAIRPYDAFMKRYLIIEWRACHGMPLQRIIGHFNIGFTHYTLHITQLHTARPSPLTLHPSPKRYTITHYTLHVIYNSLFNLDLVYLIINLDDINPVWQTFDINIILNPAIEINPAIYTID